MVKKEYCPKPVDTSDVVLPPGLLDLTEIIAENVHEVWSAGRMADGWVFGENTDSRLKTTPKLVPYSELSEAEKDYDRNTAMGTIRLIMKLGYEIVPAAEHGD